MRIIKYLIVIIAIFYIKADCLAGPIPVFELFGWIEDKNATIDEYDYNLPDRKWVKRYFRSDDIIDEYDYNLPDRKWVKRYFKSDDIIDEYDYNLPDRKWVKRYFL